MEIPFVDIHTHSSRSFLGGHVISIQNVALNNREQKPQSLCSVGFHPWYGIPLADSEPFELLKQETMNLNVVAIGECGLDKTINIPLDQQYRLFEPQVVVAQDVGKPLILHCVRAFSEILGVLDHFAFKNPVVFHGFRKNSILAKQLIEKGYYLSIGPHCLNGSQDELLKKLPLSSLFLESDVQDQISIEFIYKYVAKVRSIPLLDLKKTMYENFKYITKK